jgi:hypothetical protein
VTTATSACTSHRPADLGHLVKPPPVLTLWRPPPRRPPVNTLDAWKGLPMPDLAILQRVIDGLRKL